MEALLIIVLTVGALALGGKWLLMAASFLVKELGSECRHLNYLKVKLAILQGLADQIGRVEAEIVEKEKQARG